MSTNLDTEPVAIPGAIIAVATTGLGLAVLLGVPLSLEAVAGIVTFLGAVIALVTAFQRSKVRPVPAARRGIEN